ncbi:MAG: threonine/serine dehydratase [SAR202 cluster bacterium]|nr:threonine ammonia-lyase [Chloroflexota bacterium]MQG39505.1 threonine/serine dehydratase [SAR202 cluster bacterium]|tara:strand:+ start:221 stop:1150 length:930 start_codon:yes stop_codon:yes gene_type:complete
MRAQNRIAPYITRTPLHHYPSLDELLGAEVFVKHENHQSLGAFKLRGALNVVSQLTEKEKANGVISSSTGNFGQGVAYAGGIFGVKVVVVVPKTTNPDKIASMKRLGAELILYGTEFDESRGYAEKLAEEKGYFYVHSANDPRLTAGTGTYTLEILEDEPNIEVIIVPLGGGSGACGACVVAKAINPSIKVIGVQAEKAQGAYLSWKKGEIVTSPMETIAEGLATAMGYEYTQKILRDLLDDFVLVSEKEILNSIVLHLEKTHNLIEHAGASSLAAALKIKDEIKGKKIALIASGGNLSIEQLKIALNV